MARSPQKDFLQNVLADEEQAETASEGHQPTQLPMVHKKSVGSSVLANNGVIERLTSGATKQVVQSKVDPARCRIWPGNARRYNALTYTDCEELISSIINESGQKIPAIVRKIQGDQDYDYEVIVGTRRHWAITWLRANNYPDMTFLVQSEILTDEAAFRMADLENRVRTDVSSYERAINYLDALEKYYGGQAARMCERTGIPKSSLSKMLALARIPEEIPAAFAKLDEISLKQWYPQTAQLTSEESKKRAVAESLAIIAEQKKLASEGFPPIDGPVVAARIIAAINNKTAQPEKPRTEFCVNGSPFITILSISKTGAKIQLHKIEGASRQDIMNILGEAVTAILAPGEDTQ